MTQDLLNMPDPSKYPDVILIAAVDVKGGIGKNGGVPWDHPEDLKSFARITRYSVVIMGSKTWESLPLKYRPLKQRFNVIISSRSSEDLGVDVLTPEEKQLTVIVKSYEAALDAATAFVGLKARNGVFGGPPIQRPIPTFVIGGARVYDHAIRHPSLSAAIITHVPGEHYCDRFLSVGDIGFKLGWSGSMNIEQKFGEGSKRRLLNLEVFGINWLDGSWLLPGSSEPDRVRRVAFRGAFRGSIQKKRKSSRASLSAEPESEARAEIRARNDRAFGRDDQSHQKEPSE